MFIWKACNGALLVKFALLRRGITLDSTCPHCDNAIEDTPHALLGCHLASEVWLHSYMHIDHTQAVAMPLKDWILQMATSFQRHQETYHENLATLAHYLWGIWKERNDYHFQRRNPQPLATAVKIKTSMAPMEDPTPQSKVVAHNLKRTYEAHSIARQAFN